MKFKWKESYCYSTNEGVSLKHPKDRKGISIANIFRSRNKYKFEPEQFYWRIKIENLLKFQRKKYLDFQFSKRYQAKKCVEYIISVILNVFPNFDLKYKTSIDKNKSIEEILKEFDNEQILDNQIYKKYLINNWQLNQSLSKERLIKNLNKLREIVNNIKYYE